MPHSYNFSIIKLEPNDAREERLNIGVAILRDDGWDIRAGKKLDKLRAMSLGIREEEVRELLASIATYGKTRRKVDASYRGELAHFSYFGPISFSSLSEFKLNDSSEYEERVQKILRSMVEPEPTLNRVKLKSSRLLSQVKRSLKRERILAAKGEDLSSHRVVSALEVDQGLIADLALRNGAMHIVETVDARPEESLRKVVADVAVAALVFARARIVFGSTSAIARLIYSAPRDTERAIQPSLDVARHQGAFLYNWESATDQRDFVETLASLAVPTQRKHGRILRV